MSNNRNLGVSYANFSDWNLGVSVPTSKSKIALHHQNDFFFVFFLNSLSIIHLLTKDWVVYVTTTGCGGDNHVIFWVNL